MFLLQLAAVKGRTPTWEGVLPRTVTLKPPHPGNHLGSVFCKIPMLAQLCLKTPDSMRYG